MPHVSNLGAHKLTLRWLGIQFALPKCTQYRAQMSEMIAKGPRVYQNVVQVAQCKLVEEGLKHLSHQGREGRRSVDETEAHHHPLEVAQWCCYGCLGDILLRHPYLMKSAGKVDLAEVPRTTELIQKFLDTWDGHAILDSDGV